eukprot:gene13499-biopygen24561
MDRRRAGAAAAAAAAAAAPPDTAGTVGSQVAEQCIDHRTDAQCNVHHTRSPTSEASRGRPRPAQEPPTSIPARRRGGSAGAAGARGGRGCYVMGGECVTSRPRIVNERAGGDGARVGVVPEGTRVRVIEVERRADIRRLRGRVAQPRGWISLEDLDTGERWVRDAEGGRADADRPGRCDAHNTPPMR